MKSRIFQSPEKLFHRPQLVIRHALNHFAPSANSFLAGRRSLLAVVALLFMALAGLAPAQVYVDIDAPGGGDGASWGAAFQSIQTGIDTANTSGILEVWVAEGTYEEALTAVSGVSVYGGFVGNELTRDPRDLTQRMTVVDGNATTRVLTMDSVTTVTLDGLIFSNGSAQGVGDEAFGGGAWIENAGVTNVIRDCGFTASAAISGGGVYLGAGADLTFEGCTFTNNTATSAGAGLYLGVCSPLFSGCTIAGNAVGPNVTDLAYGGGAYCDNGSAAEFLSCAISANSVSTTISFTGGGGIFTTGSLTTITSCTFAGNTSTDGGGALFVVSLPSPVITNCVFAGNFARTAGGAVVLRRTSPAITNCTFYANNTSVPNAGGISTFFDAYPVITNCIFARNKNHAIREQSFQTIPEIINCVFFDNPNGHFYDDTSGSLNTEFEIDNFADPSTQTTNNIVGDPAFITHITGRWTTVTFNVDNNRTLLLDGAAPFTAGALPGRLINPDRGQLRHSIVAWNSATTIEVAGDVTGFTSAGDTYELVDLELASGSAALDSATSAGAPAVDIAGVARPVDIPGQGADGTGGEYDVGAYELFPPDIAIASDADDPTSVTPIVVTVTFTKDMIDFIATDVAITNGVVQNFVELTPRSFIFEVALIGEGTVEASVPAGVCTDRSLLPNPASSTISRVFDVAGPVVTFSSSANEWTAVSPIPFAAQFDQDTFGFDGSDLAFTNATPQNFVAVDARNYTFELVPLGQGAVSVSLPAGVCVDDANNPNPAGGPVIRTFDTQGPTVVLSSATGDPTNASPIPVTAQFNEGVLGFTAGDISSANASVQNFVAVSAQTYTFDLAPSGQGTVGASVAGGVCTDLAGNANTAAAPFSRVYDSVSPGVTMSSALPNPTNWIWVSVIVDFTEDVTGFTAGDIVPGNATVSSFFVSSPRRYGFRLNPLGQGVVTADIAAGVCSDAAGNPNPAAVQFNHVYDSVNPGVAMSSALPNPTNWIWVSVFVDFTEDVTGFTIADVVPGNATVSNFWVVSPRRYSFRLNPLGQGVVTADLAAGVCRDVAGNTNLAASQFSHGYDSVRPDLTMSSSLPNPTNWIWVSVFVDFTEDVTGFTAGDIVPGNATVSNFWVVSPRRYGFRLNPIGQGAVTAAVAAGVCRDIAGNNNNIAAQFSHVYDSVGPDVTLSSSLPNPTNVSGISVFIDFTEDVTGFTVDDIVPGNATVSNLATISPSRYSFQLNPTGQGEVTADVAAGVCRDIAGNTNTAAARFSRVYDSVRPDVEMSSGLPNPTSWIWVSAFVDFSEDVTGFTAADIVPGNATVSNFWVISPRRYGFRLNPTAEGELTADIAAGACRDAAGNTNPAAQFSHVYDPTSPESQVTGPTSGSLVTASSFTLEWTHDDGASGSGAQTVEIFWSRAAAATVHSLGVFPADATPTFDTRGKGGNGDYFFYSVATDAAGNVEAAPTEFDIRVQVHAPPQLGARFWNHYR